MILKDQVARFVANHLPARVAYFTAIRVVAHACSGDYGNQEVPALEAMVAIKRFGNDCVDWPSVSN